MRLQVTANILKVNSRMIFLWNDKFKETAVVNTFITAVSVSTISNYSPGSYLLKSLFSALLLFFIYNDLRAKKTRIKEVFSPLLGDTSFYSLILLLVLTGLSLLYSENRIFGFEKWMSITVGVTPLIISFSYLFITRTPLRERVFFYSLIFWGVFISMLILITDPFYYDTLYMFSWTRWSHVILGRLLGPVVLITFLLIMTSSSGRRLSVLIPVNLFIFLGLYHTGHRSTVLCIIIMEILISAYSIIKKRSRIGFILLITAALSAAYIFIMPLENQAIKRRYSNMFSSTENGKIKNIENLNDGSIISRIEAFNISLRKFADKPVLGWGFGGFRTYYISDLPLWMKYPHNIVLEFAAELGIAGLFLLGLILFSIIRGAASVSPSVLFYFIFSFLLALFSKDIPSQSLFLIGLGLPAGIRFNLFNKTRNLIS